MLYNSNQNIFLQFQVVDTQDQFKAKYEGDFTLYGVAYHDRTVLHCTFIEGLLTFQILFNKKPWPLKLRAKVLVGDEVRISIIPYRLQMMVNGVVQDEEWYFGEPYFDRAKLICENTKVELGVLPIEEKREEPIVVGTFEKAEGWKPSGNVFVGDCMPHIADGRYHVVYLRDRHHHRSKWGLGAHEYAHISTDDFEHWQIHPDVLKLEHEEEGSFCTGSFVQKDGKYYVYYTVRQNTCPTQEAAPLMRAVSNDGYHFVKDDGFKFYLSEKYYTQETRDPKIFQDEEGLWHILLTTAIRETEKGCLAHIVSKDCEHWTELEPFYISEDDVRPECPDYFKIGDTYYFLFGRSGRAEYRYSKNPFGDWKIPENPYIPCGRVPKCAFWEDKLIFVGFRDMENADYAGTMTFANAEIEENGILHFIK